jgi:hypothetical protein
MIAYRRNIYGDKPNLDPITRFNYIVKTINCVEEERVASMKYSG